MISKPLFREVFYLLFVVAVLNLLAIKFYLYWTVSEFDSLVHFLGGAFVGMLFLWLYFYSGIFDPQKRDLKNFVVISILSVILVGVLWEVFELIIGATNVNDLEYYFDTALDIVMDILGSLLSCFYAYIKEINIKNIKHSNVQ